MSGKKIAITLFKYFPYGGLQKDFLGIAEELYKRNYTLKVFTRSWSGEIPAWLDVMEIGENGLTNASKDRKFVDDVFLRKRILLQLCLPCSLYFSYDVY